MSARIRYLIGMSKDNNELRPTSVSVLGIEVKINYSKDLSDELLGYYDSETLEVWVRDGLNAENTRLILWHELCHVVESLGDIKISESGICLMSTGFIQMMKDNPTLASWSFGSRELRK